jgi:hypothetical protein
MCNLAHPFSILQPSSNPLVNVLIPLFVDSKSQLSLGSKGGLHLSATKHGQVAQCSTHFQKLPSSFLPTLKGGDDLPNVDHNTIHFTGVSLSKINCPLVRCPFYGLNLGTTSYANRAPWRQARNYSGSYNQGFQSLGSLV